MPAAQPKNRLGRGLASLIGDLETELDTSNATHGHHELNVTRIAASPLNPRGEFDRAELEELAHSIREKGLVQPIIVRPARDGGADYEIVAGERRWRAAQLAALHKIPAIIQDLSDQEALEIAIIENVQRSDLNAIEEAQGYQQLISRFDYKQEDLAGIIGKSRSHLANTLRMLKLPAAVQDMVRNGDLSAGHARALVGQPDATTIARQIVRKGLNVRAAEALAQRARQTDVEPKRRHRDKDANTRAAEVEISSKLGLAVEISPGKAESGELRIRYRTLDQLEEVRRRLLAR